MNSPPLVKTFYHLCLKKAQILLDMTENVWLGLHYTSFP